MFCSKCGNEVKEGSKFCGVCGNPTGAAASKQPVSETQQVNRATPIPYASQPNSNTGTNFTPPSADQTKSWLMAEAKCIPAFVLGLIAGINGIMGGYCTTAITLSSYAAPLMIFVPSIIGLVGACLCFKRAHLGSVLMFIPGITILIKGWFMYGGAEFMSILAMLLFWIGGIVGLAMTRQSK